MKTIPFQALEPALYRETVRRALAEDLGWGDVTTDATVPPDVRASGVILAKSPCVLAGIDVATEAFSPARSRLLDCAQASQDGDRCQPGDVVAELRGLAAPMLTAERTALNFLQRLSGIATLTRQFVDASGGRDHGPRHAQDHADAACAGEIRRPRRCGHQPSRRTR